MRSYNSLVQSCFQTTFCYCSDVLGGDRKYGGSHLQPKKLNLVSRKINSVPKKFKFDAGKIIFSAKKNPI